MFWSGFFTALMLVAVAWVLRWLLQARAWSTAAGAERIRIRELHRCGMQLQAQGLEAAATTVWLSLATRHPRFGLIAEHYLAESLLSGRGTDLAFVEAYRSLLAAHPADPGLRYKLGKALRNAGELAEARDCWLQVARGDEPGWRYRAVEDLAATEGLD